MNKSGEEGGGAAARGGSGGKEGAFPGWKSWKDASPTLRIATLGPLGWCRPAPGTAATALAGIPAAWICGHFHPLVQLAVVVAVFVVGCRASTVAAEELGEGDPRGVVIDELAGYLVTMLWLPVGMKSLLLAFAAFRLFDIMKPWPVNVLDRQLKGGFGIMADDVAAGLYGHAVVWTILQIWP